MHGNKLSNSEVIEIYKCILERKKKHNVPYTVSIKIYGLQSWSALREKALRIKGKH